MNLRDFDLNLLLIFNAVYADRSITRAAEKLGMTQPAVSNALTRLRKQIGDPLFERSGQGMEPSPEARRLAPEIQEAIRMIRDAVSLTEKFDPATSTRRFLMIMPDAIESAIMVPLLADIPERTPGLNYSLEPLFPNDFTQAILSKTVDVGFFPSPVLEERVRTALLFSEPSCIVVRASHPVYGGREQFTLDDLFEAQFIAIAPELRMLTQIDQQCNVLGRKRRIVCTTKRIWSVPYMVASSDLAGMLPRNIAETVAGKLGLRLFDPPMNLPPETWHMVWHEDFDGNSAHYWLRGKIMGLFAGQNAKLKV